VNWARREGRDCVKALPDRDRTTRLLASGQGEEEEEACPSKASSEPVRELFARSSCSSLGMVESWDGSPPLSPAEETCKTRKVDSRAISVGREDPVNRFPPSVSCCSIGQEPIQEGMGPRSKLSWIWRERSDLRGSEGWSPKSPEKRFPPRCKAAKLDSPASHDGRVPCRRLDDAPKANRDDSEASEEGRPVRELLLRSNTRKDLRAERDSGAELDRDRSRSDIT
jgi:hypothetical protein